MITLVSAHTPNRFGLGQNSIKCSVAHALASQALGPPASNAGADTQDSNSPAPSSLSPKDLAFHAHDPQALATHLPIADMQARETPVSRASDRTPDPAAHRSCAILMRGLPALTLSLPDPTPTPLPQAHVTCCLVDPPCPLPETSASPSLNFATADARVQDAATAAQDAFAFQSPAQQGFTIQALDIQVPAPNLPTREASIPILDNLAASMQTPALQVVHPPASPFCLPTPHNNTHAQDHPAPDTSALLAVDLQAGTTQAFAPTTLTTIDLPASEVNTPHNPIQESFAPLAVDVQVSATHASPTPLATSHVPALPVNALSFLVPMAEAQSGATPASTPAIPLFTLAPIPRDALASHASTPLAADLHCRLQVSQVETLAPAPLATLPLHVAAHSHNTAALNPFALLALGVQGTADEASATLACAMHSTSHPTHAPYNPSSVAHAPMDLDQHGVAVEALALPALLLHLYAQDAQPPDAPAQDVFASQDSHPQNSAIPAVTPPVIAFHLPAPNAHPPAQDVPAQDAVVCNGVEMQGPASSAAASRALAHPAPRGMQVLCGLDRSSCLCGDTSGYAAKLSTCCKLW